MRDLPAIICAAQAGEQDAFVELVERFHSMAVWMVTDRLADPDLALDVVQEAWLEAYLSLPNLRIPAAFSTWFRRILIKHIDRYLRKHQVPCTSLDATMAQPISHLDGLEIVLRRENQDHLNVVLHHLPDSLREVALRFYRDGESQQHIADRLGIPLTTVKKRLYLARQRIGIALLAPEMDPSTVLPQTLGRWTVPFWLALWTGDADRVHQLLRLDPTLVHQREQPVPILTQRLWMDLTPGFTPLHRAVAHRDRVLTRMLLDAQADCNAVTPSGITPLHLAVLANARDLVRLLLAAGASVHARTTSGLSPLHWAMWRHCRQLVALLEQAGASLAIPDHSPRQWHHQTDPERLLPRHQKPQLGAILLGRVVDPDGHPLDGQGPFPALSQHAHPDSPPATPLLLETGIKVLDLFAPLRRGGIIAVQAPPGVGQIILLSELLHRAQGCAVVLSFIEHAVASHRLVQAMRTNGLASSVTLILCPRQATSVEHERWVAYGQDIARSLAAHHQVYFLVEHVLMQTTAAWHHLTHRSTPRMTTLMYTLDASQLMAPYPHHLDGQIVLSPQLARQGIYPAIDPLRSTSCLLQESTLPSFHRELVAHLRRFLTSPSQRAQPLRAERLRWFQTQPFFVTEPFTARRGQGVDLLTTLHDYATILEGRMDAVPLPALHFTGSLTPG